MIRSKIYLASQSARRRELLSQIGVDHEVIVIDIDERVRAAEDHEAYVLRLAHEKAHTGLASSGYQEPWPVLGADTVVLFNEKILGKPKDKADFTTTLQELSNNTHTVLTGVCLATHDRTESITVKTHVKFRPVEKEEIDFYWENYTPLDKAGGYGIQDYAAVFVEWIQGSYSNVVGLPLYETHQLLTKFFLACSQK